MSRTPGAREAGARGARAAVDAYLAALPPRHRSALRKVRAAIRAAAPGAEERISYKVPSFALGGRTFVWYAAWEHHCSLYPIPAAMRAHPALAKYERARGTIRFPPDAPPPARLVAQLVRALIAGRVGPKR
ncbi:MAG TPA: DUF1801 domain-containing protein [Gemmatimonadales bacterium]|nr:DUF1801 domain-containing protein [Gemmatimonadales bacterium]